MTEKNKLFCFGYGYVADTLARALKQTGAWTIAGTTRDMAKADVLHDHDIDAHLMTYDHGMADPLRALAGATHILISTPPDDQGDPSYLFHAEDLLKIPGVKWVGYLSTTGVYGDRNGDWVDEKSSIQPTTKRGSRRARAEDQWRSLHDSYSVPVHIFRLAGIYGPGRSSLESVRAGSARRINKTGQAFSRVHVDDIVQTLIASFAKPNPGAVYNVADDYPAPSHEVIAYTCEILGQEVPPLLDYTSADLAPITVSFYSDNKNTPNKASSTPIGSPKAAT